MSLSIEEWAGKSRGALLADLMDTGRDGVTATEFVARERIAELEAALKPFAEAIYYFDHDGNFAVQKEHIKNSDYLRAKKAFLDAK